MNIFQKILFKLLGVKEEQEPLSMHDLVANEIRILVRHVLVKRQLTTMDSIYRLTDDNAMNWFRIRERNYGESGSHYGIAELLSQPGQSNPAWPAWLKLIPTDNLKDIWLELSNLLKERQPLGGHQLHEENRLKAANEFADQLIFRLYEMEKASRQ